jgi:hypothetical protein
MKRFWLTIFILATAFVCLGIDNAQQKKRPTKILRPEDMTPTNLEKVFRHYDDLINSVESAVPARVVTVIKDMGITSGAADTSGGDIKAVTAQTGITGGGTTGSVAVALDTTFAATKTFVTGQVAGKQALTDTSTTDATRYWVTQQGYGTGDISEVTAQTGITGGGAAGSVAVALDTTFAATKTYVSGQVAGKQALTDTSTTDATRYWVAQQGYGNGDISEVTAQTGITGGGSTGSVAVALDTTFAATQSHVAINYEKLNGYRWTKHFAGLKETIYNGGSLPVSGAIFGLAGQVDTVFADDANDGIWLEGNTELTMPTSQVYYFKKTVAGSGFSAMMCKDKRNVLIQGGTIDGLADPAIDQEHDMGLYLSSDTNVVVKDITINNVGGDNIYIGGGQNYLIQNVRMHNPVDAGRNGIGLTAGNLNVDTLRTVKIIDCVFTGHGGPGLLDIEPHGTNTVVEDVLIDGCTFNGKGIGWVGLEIYGGSGTNVMVRDVIVSNCHFEDLSRGVWLENVGTGVLGNIQFNNCTFYNCDRGIHVAGGTADIKFNNCKTRFCGEGFYVEGVNVNLEFNNCEAGYSKRNGIHIVPNVSDVSKFPRRVRINGGRFYNNGTDGSGNGIYVHGANDTYVYGVNLQYNDDYAVSLYGCDGVIVAQCIFENNGTNDVQKLNACNDVMQMGNVCGDESDGHQRLVFDQYNYTPGWHRSVVLMDTTASDSVDTAIRIGGIASFRNDAAQWHTTSRHGILFSGFRDVCTNTLGGKLILQNYATNSTAGHHYWTQEANFLFYLLTDGTLPTSVDNTELKMILTGKGLGLNNDAYITFSSDVSDTSWKTVGEDGYGLRDNGGAVEFKNSGGSWAGIGNLSDSDSTVFTTPFYVNWRAAVAQWNANKLNGYAVSTDGPNTNNALVWSGSAWAPTDISAVYQAISDTSSKDATRYWVLSQGFGTGAGDIEGVTAGFGLTGGGTSGTVTVAADSTKLATPYYVLSQAAIAQWNANRLMGKSVSGTTPTANQVLQYVGSGWIPNDLPAEVGDISSVTAGWGITGGGNSGGVSVAVDTTAGKVATAHDLTSGLAGKVGMTGNETIAGEKTFSNGIKIGLSSAGNGIDMGGNSSIVGLRDIWHDETVASDFHIINKDPDKCIVFGITGAGETSAYYFTRFDNDSTIDLGNYSAGNFFEIKKDGTPRLNGDASAFNVIDVPGLAMKINTNPPTMTAGFAGDSDLELYYFASTVSNNQVYFTVQIPHDWEQGSNITPRVHWAPTTDASAGDDTTAWELKYTWGDMGETFSSGSTLTVKSAGGANAQWDHKVGSFSAISGSGHTFSSVLVCRLRRLQDNNSDTYADNAALLGVDFVYEVDSMGSDTELTKN